MISKDQIANIMEDYDSLKLRIGMTASHSALDICDGAIEEGFPTVAHCQKGREKTYSSYFKTQRTMSGRVRRGMVDKAIVMDSFNDVMKPEMQAEMRKRNVIYIPNRSFTSYSSIDDVENNFQVSKKVNIHTNQVIKKYSRAFWAISPNKDIGASLNFARISIKRPGYGYKGLSKDGLVEKVSLFNLNSGLDEYSIELSDILDQINFISGRKDPYLNHIAWSPCSTKILSLFHYHAKPNDEKEVYPIVYDLVKNKMKKLSIFAWSMTFMFLTTSIILS